MTNCECVNFNASFLQKSRYVTHSLSTSILYIQVSYYAFFILMHSYKVFVKYRNSTVLFDPLSCELSVAYILLDIFLYVCTHIHTCVIFFLLFFSNGLKLHTMLCGLLYPLNSRSKTLLQTNHCFMLILGDSEIPHLSHLSYENKLDLPQSLVCKPGISTIFFFNF